MKYKRTLTAILAFNLAACGGGINVIPDNRAFRSSYDDANKALKNPIYTESGYTNNVEVLQNAYNSLDGIKFQNVYSKFFEALEYAAGGRTLAEAYKIRDRANEKPRNGRDASCKTEKVSNNSYKIQCTGMDEPIIVKDGRNGKDGLTVVGANGEDGSSCSVYGNDIGFSIKCDNGTEIGMDWVDLTGPTGPMGPMGPAGATVVGPPGSPGKDGKPGKTTVIHIPGPPIKPVHPTGINVGPGAGDANNNPTVSGGKPNSDNNTGNVPVGTPTGDTGGFNFGN